MQANNFGSKNGLFISDDKGKAKADHMYFKQITYTLLA
jgi:hypothetical protein